MAEKDLRKRVHELAVQQVQELKKKLEQMLLDFNLDEFDDFQLIINEVKDFWRSEKNELYAKYRADSEENSASQRIRNFLEEIESAYNQIVLNRARNLSYLVNTILPELKSKALKIDYPGIENQEESKSFIETFSEEKCISFLEKKHVYFKTTDLIDIEVKNLNIKSLYRYYFEERTKLIVSDLKIVSFQYNHLDRKILIDLLNELDLTIATKHAKWSKFILLTDILFSNNLAECKPIVYSGASNTLIYLLDELAPFFDEKISPAILSAYKLIRLGNNKYLTEGNYYAIRSRNKNKFPKYYDEIERLVASAIKKTQTNSSI